MDRHTSAHNDWNDEISSAPHSALAFAFSSATDSFEKWKILSLNWGGLNLLINCSGWVKGSLITGPYPSGNQRFKMGGREIEIITSSPSDGSD